MKTPHRLQFVCSVQSVFVLSIYAIMFLNNTYIIVNRNVHTINTNRKVLIINVSRNVNEIEDDRMLLKSNVCFLSLKLKAIRRSYSRHRVMSYVWTRAWSRRLSCTFFAFDASACLLRAWKLAISISTLSCFLMNCPMSLNTDGPGDDNRLFVDNCNAMLLLNYSFEDRIEIIEQAACI